MSIHSHVLLDVMYVKTPYAAIQRAMHIPTVAEYRRPPSPNWGRSPRCRISGSRGTYLALR
ncbi:MAG: hypothetical protein WBF04_09640 [Candidatus Sulfotelmatobacter sp.]